MYQYRHILTRMRQGASKTERIREHSMNKGRMLPQHPQAQLAFHSYGLRMPCETNIDDEDLIIVDPLQLVV